jgi:hypothetical protein
VVPESFILEESKMSEKYYTGAAIARKRLENYLDEKLGDAWNVEDGGFIYDDEYDEDEDYESSDFDYDDEDDDF